MKYDIIGDIHGCSQTLEKLLQKLEYSRGSDEVYQRPDRTAIFLGDFIDRGPFQREVLSIVMPMIDSGYAKSVMGNHEYNAVAYATPGERSGEHLRCHSQNNTKQHKEFLDAYADDQVAYSDVIEWFKTLPLWHDLGDIRIIHACWDREIIRKIGSPVLTDELLHASCNKSHWQYDAIETILKGKEVPLPRGHSFDDKDGNERHEIRVLWWDQSARTYSRAFLGSASSATHIPDEEIAGDYLIEYSRDEPPVFLGHYWMEDDPEPLAPNVACVDYSVAKPGGKLVAYRWDGEGALDRGRYVAVDRVE